MTKNTLIKLSSLGFAGIVAYGTYNFIEKNEKILNFLTRNSKLKNINSDVDHEDINNSISYKLRDTNNTTDNVQKQTLLKVKEFSDNFTISKQETPINTVNNISSGISLITEKSEPKTTSISNSASIKKPQTPKKRLRSREQSRRYGFLFSLN